MWSDNVIDIVHSTTRTMQRLLILSDTDPMAILRLVIDDEVPKRARIKAREQGTSVHVVVREQLARYANPDRDPRSAMARFVELARRSSAGSGPDGRTWTRESLYDR